MTGHAELALRRVDRKLDTGADFLRQTPIRSPFALNPRPRAGIGVNPSGAATLANSSRSVFRVPAATTTRPARTQAAAFVARSVKCTR